MFGNLAKGKFNFGVSKWFFETISLSAFQIKATPFSYSSREPCSFIEILELFSLND